MREASLEKSFVKAVESIGGLAPKWVSPGNNGVPDRIVVLPEGKVAFVELKAPGKKLKPLQQRWRRRLLCLNHTACVIDSIDGVNAFIEDCKHGRI